VLRRPSEPAALIRHVAFVDGTSASSLSVAIIYRPWFRSAVRNVLGPIADGIAWAIEAIETIGGAIGKVLLVVLWIALFILFVSLLVSGIQWFWRNPLF